MRYVIIGGSAAGVSSVEAIRVHDKKSSITLISDEDFPLYSRCLLSYLLQGAIGEDGLYFKDKEFYKMNNVEALLGTRAESIDVKNQFVTLSNKTKVDFDRLLVATGARSKMLDIPGIDKDCVFALRTIADARAIQKRLNKVKTAVILGGGLIGLRAAYALKKRGVNIKVVVRSNQVLSQILDSGAASLIQAKIEQEGIEVLKGRDAKEIIGAKAVEAVMLDDGAKIDCQLVVVGKGVGPNTELAKAAGINVKEGIVVNFQLETDKPAILAAGDVAEAMDITYGENGLNALWPCAVEQGRIAGLNMVGKKVVYNGSFGMNSVEFFGLPVISMGITKPKGQEYEELVAIDKSRPLYKKVVLKNKVIKGFISLGRIENSGVYHILIKSQVSVEKIKDRLLSHNFGFADIAELIKENKELFKAEEFKDTIWTY